MPTKDPCAELSQVITDLAMMIGEDPRFDTIDKVTAELRAHIPELTREDVVNSIVEATTTHREALDETRAQLAALKREARQDKALREAISELQSHLDAETMPETGTRPKPGGSDIIKALRKTRDRLKSDIRGSDTAVRKRLGEAIDRLTEKLENVRGVPPVNPKTIPENAELARMEYEKRKLQRLVREKIDSLRPRTFWHKLSGVSAASRTIRTAYDLSAPLRQGAFLAASHPRTAARAARDMFAAIKDQAVADRINRDIIDGPNAVLYERSGLHLTPIDGTLTKREEAFMSRWAEKHIPGIAVSQRTYVTFLNSLRSQVFDGMTETMSQTGAPTLEEATVIANFVNVASGRGSLDMGPFGNWERAAVPLAQTLFSPRLLASRFQYIFGQPLYSGSWRTRKLIAQEYARTIAGFTLAYSIYSMFNDDEENALTFDPRSSDFGKMRFGRTRVDPMAGLSQVVSLLGRTVSGQTKRQSGKVVPLVGEVPFGQDNLWDVWARFGRQKLAPFPSAVVNLIVKEDVVGQPVTKLGAVTSVFLPLQLEQTHETLKEHGFINGSALAALGFFGMGLGTYGPENAVELAAAERKRLEWLEESGTIEREDRRNLARLKSFDSARRKLEKAIEAAEARGDDARATELQARMESLAVRAVGQTDDLSGPMR